MGLCLPPGWVRASPTSFLREEAQTGAAVSERPAWGPDPRGCWHPRREHGPTQGLAPKPGHRAQMPHAKGHGVNHSHQWTVSKSLQFAGKVLHNSSLNSVPSQLPLPPSHRRCLRALGWLGLACRRWTPTTHSAHPTPWLSSSAGRWVIPDENTLISLIAGRSVSPVPPPVQRLWESWHVHLPQDPFLCPPFSAATDQRHGSHLGSLSKGGCPGQVSGEGAWLP